VADDGICLLLLPRKLEGFILRDQAEDLLRAVGVVAADPPRIPYGALARMPRWLADGLATRQGRRLAKAVPGTLKAVVIFHPVQYPTARGVLTTAPDCELWYGRWDRYEDAYDASPKMRTRLTELHEMAARRAALQFVASDELARQETAMGREAVVVGLASDTFPAPQIDGSSVIAVSLGHLGWRTDWALLRAVGEQMDDLTLLLIGAWHDDECKDDPDYAWCRAHPGFVWLGQRSDSEAARLIGCADVGIVPFKREPFNDAALPYRILKYALLGRATVSLDLAGVHTWDRAVTTADDADAFVAALRAHAGARVTPDAALREWALAHSARSVNDPLWKRMTEIGVDVRSSASRSARMP
jgi:hypothetical protein